MRVFKSLRKIMKKDILWKCLQSFTRIYAKTSANKQIFIYVCVYVVVWSWVKNQDYTSNHPNFLWFERNWVFATNSDFLITISLEPNAADLRYLKLWILLDQIIWVWNIKGLLNRFLKNSFAINNLINSKTTHLIFEYNTCGVRIYARRSARPKMNIFYYVTKKLRKTIKKKNIIRNAYFRSVQRLFQSSLVYLETLSKSYFLLHTSCPSYHLQH